jgi:hypothetical protein
MVESLGSEGWPGLHDLARKINEIDLPYAALETARERILLLIDGKMNSTRLERPVASSLIHTRQNA